MKRDLRRISSADACGTYHGQTPKDWDVTTDAKPEQIQKLFPIVFMKMNLVQSV